MDTLLAPSLLSADHARLGEEIRAVQEGGADWLHVDVMDGHFVPNLTLGPPLIASLRKTTRLPFDVHLMIEAPERSLEAYAAAGANHLTVHQETCPHLYRTLTQITALGVKAGVSINPATPLYTISEVLHMVDLVLVMTVNPGFGGQKFIPEMTPKIAALAELRRTRDLPLRICVDGGITTDTIKSAARAGADVFIAGSAIFGTTDYGFAMDKLRKAAAQGRESVPG